MVVKEAVKRLQPRVTSLFLVKDIWLPCVPFKVVFYIWETI